VACDSRILGRIARLQVVQNLLLTLAFPLWGVAADLLGYMWLMAALLALAATSVTFLEMLQYTNWADGEGLNGETPSERLRKERKARRARIAAATASSTSGRQPSSSSSAVPGLGGHAAEAAAPGESTQLRRRPLVRVTSNSQGPQPHRTLPYAAQSPLR